MTKAFDIEIFSHQKNGEDIYRVPLWKDKKAGNEISDAMLYVEKGISYRIDKILLQNDYYKIVFDHRQESGIRFYLHAMTENRASNVYTLTFRRGENSFLYFMFDKRYKSLNVGLSRGKFYSDIDVTHENISWIDYTRLSGLCEFIPDWIRKKNNTSFRYRGLMGKIERE